ncbi:unnamed protein product, partial [Rotaria sp. Silwood1]
HVSNIPFRFRDDDLKAMFEQFGDNDCIILLLVVVLVLVLLFVVDSIIDDGDDDTLTIFGKCD